MKNLQYIQVDISKGVATLWLNRPEVHNALNNHLLSEITYCFKKINNLDNIRAVVLRGNGKSFCSGADISWLKSDIKNLGKDSKKQSKLLATCFNTIYSCKIPVIALVHGNVIAGGVGLISSCDIVIASDNAVFSIPETRIGIIPATILPYLLTRMSLSQAKLLMFTAQKLSAPDAHKIGLIDLVSVHTELDQKLETILNDILKAAPGAIRELKVFIRDIYSKHISENLIHKTINTLTRIKSSNEAKEGMGAFFEKRTPAWFLNNV